LAPPGAGLAEAEAEGGGAGRIETEAWTEGEHERVGVSLAPGVPRTEVTVGGVCTS
jgi:hypothetical protein